MSEFNYLNSPPLCHELSPTIFLLRWRKISLRTRVFDAMCPAEGQPRPCKLPCLLHSVQRQGRTSIIGDVNVKLLRWIIQRHGWYYSVHHLQSWFLLRIHCAYEDVDRRKVIIFRQSFRKDGTSNWPPTVGLVEKPHKGENQLAGKYQKPW